METINISQEELSKYPLFNKGGFESKILLYNEQLLFKCFEPYLKGIIDFDGKRKKLERFSLKKWQPNIITVPTKLVTVDNEFAGYLMPKIDDAITIDHIKDYRVLLNMYISLFKKLEYLHNQGIVICDLKRENIIVNQQGEPTFIDVDSMGIDELKPDNFEYIPKEGKTIPYIREKKNLNSPEDFDKLLLLACFLNSLSTQNENAIKKIANSKLSPETQNIFLEYINNDRLKNIDFTDILTEERKR